MMLNKTIRLFLDGIGRRDEYEFYLNKFQAGHSACFALLCPDLGSLELGAEMLTFDLQFLLQLELVPAILLQGEEAEQMQDLLAHESIFVFESLSSIDAEEFVQQARAAGKVPVFVEKKSGLVEALKTLVPTVVKRVHLIRAAGSLRSEEGRTFPYVYTQKEMPDGVLREDRAWFDLGKGVLKSFPGIHLSVTSPINLLQEIFTVKGAGTLFRKGSEICSLSSSADLDRARLVELLETSFGKPLTNRAFLDQISCAYIEKAYRGAVLLEEHDAGFYLSKFAVGHEARGEGLAQELWQAVYENHPALFWRSAVSNPFNAWYQNQADGYHITEKWQVFWRGINPLNISSIIEFCNIRPPDFG